MYGWAPNGMGAFGGLGDTCSDLQLMYRSYVNPANTAAVNASNYAQYVNVAQNSGCTPVSQATLISGALPGSAPATSGGTAIPSTPVQAAGVPSYSISAAQANPQATANQMLAQDPNMTPAQLAYSLQNQGIASSLTTSIVLTAFIPAVQVYAPNVNANLIGAAVSKQWNSGSPYMIAQSLNAPAPAPVVAPPAVVSSGGGTSVQPGPPQINPQIPVTTPAQSTQAAQQVAQQVVAAAPDSTLQQVAQQVQAAVPTATPNDVTNASTQAVAAVVSAAVPSAPPAQVLQAVASAPATPPSQIASGVAMTTSGGAASSAGGGTSVQPGPPIINPQIVPASSTAGAVPSVPGTVTPPSSTAAAGIPMVDQATGNVTPAASTAGAVIPGATTPAASWCFPGDTSAPFSSAVPVCSQYAHDRRGHLRGSLSPRRAALICTDFAVTACTDLGIHAPTWRPPG